MKYFLLTFDLEEFSIPKEYGLKIGENNQLNISKRGLEHILETVEKYKTKTTFFTTYFFAKHYPEEIKKLSKKYEIALHGYKHSDNYEKMNNYEIKKRLNKAKNGLEKITGKKVLGFRSPRMEKINKSVLRKVGFLYDSSLHPTWVPGRYNKFSSPRNIFHKDVIVVPISVTPILKLPFSWIWFRNFGLNYAKLCTNLSLLSDIPFLNLYFHPWEFINLEKWSISPLIKNKTGKKMCKIFDSYLSWCQSKKFKFISIKDFLERKTQ